MKSQQMKKVAVFYCDICGEKCGKSMTTFEQPDKEYHTCSGFHNMVPCRTVMQMRLEDTHRQKSKTARNRA